MRTFRRVLVIGLAAAVLVAGATVAVGGWLWSRIPISTAGEVDFANPLAIPPLAPSQVDVEGRRVFSLTAAEGSHDFGSGHGRVPTWGFNGGHLGPTLRAARGEQVVVDVTNELAEPTSVHWHGMELPARMDGGPHQPVEPGETWSPSWRIDQPAATLWYHPHPHGETARHVYRGLAGMFLVDDPEAGQDLPDEYGVDDIPVVVRDQKLTRSGHLDEQEGFRGGGIGILGDTVAVNGTVGPYLDVTTERVRLRLLNGSTARTYSFGFADDRQFDLVGTDGGLLAEPHRTGRIMLSPAERAEIVVTMAPGERAVLRSFPPPLEVGFWDRLFGGDDTLDIMELRAAGELAESPEVPATLAEVPRLHPTEAVETRTFRLDDSLINGQRMAMGRIDAAPTRDTVEIWRVTNAGGMTHSFHVHGVQFQVLTVDGEPPPPHLGGWKDTVYLPRDVPVDLIMRFTGHTDPDTPYMFHCHVLVHEDEGMMGQFVVVEPGQPAGTPHDH